MQSDRQFVIETLGIDLDRLWQHLALEEDDQGVVCQSLLGYSRQEIALRAMAQWRQCSEVELKAALEHIRDTADGLKQTAPHLSKAQRQAKLSEADQALCKQLKQADQRIGDRLNGKIYPALAQLMAVPQKAIAGNWTKILNFLYNPQNGYRLNPPLQLNSDNFQGSLGRQIFLPPPNQAVAQSQREGTRFYQRGLYYQAFNAFASAWRQEQATCGQGNPEVLIYLSNCLVELYRDRWQALNINSYTVAVVVPFNHNQGQVASEILRGVAQLQWQTNWRCLEQGRFDRELDRASLPPTEPADRFEMGQPVALQVMVVNDLNRIYDADNPTAERLAALASELNLMAVIGHYSSEMTAKALPFYALAGLPLINASSTSDTLSQLSDGLRQSFWQLTTPDAVNAKALMDHLAEQRSSESAGPQRLAIIYNHNSQYCRSYRAVVQGYVAAHPEQFTVIAECDRIGDQSHHIHRFLQAMEAQAADVLLMIPDGGIEPNSLNNAGLISRLNLKQCLIAGSATLYQDNVLHWMYERHRLDTTNATNATDATMNPAIVACVPWHPHSQTNGMAANVVAQQFGHLGQSLWGKGCLTWRSATAFDALLMVKTMLARKPCARSTDLLQQLDYYFRLQQKSLPGVTGSIQFAPGGVQEVSPGGNRAYPPTEIAVVKPDTMQQRWVWDIAEAPPASL